jgi:hypothetical protein
MFFDFILNIKLLRHFSGIMFASAGVAIYACLGHHTPFSGHHPFYGPNSQLHQPKIKRTLARLPLPNPGNGGL